MNIIIKIHIIISLLIIGSGCVNADQENIKKDFWAGIGSSGNFHYLFKEDKLIVKVSSKSTDGTIKGSERYWDSQDIENLSLCSDNYLRSNFFDSEQVILYGGGWCLFDAIKPFKLTAFFPEFSSQKSIDNGRISYVESCISSVLSSSELVENTKDGDRIYTASGLLETLIQNNRLGFPSKWNHELVPWAEGEDGPGIGVTLDISYSEPTNHLLVINGYVDFDKTYLYKANNRVKEAIFRSLDSSNPFEIKYVFEDYVNIHEITFPKAITKAQMEIVSVYPGEKWDDTVITGMLTRNPDADYYYNKFKDTFFDGANQFETGMQIEWDEPPVK